MDLFCVDMDIWEKSGGSVGTCCQGSFVSSPGVWLVPWELKLDLCREGKSSAASSSLLSGGAAVSWSSLGAWLVVTVLEVLAEVEVDGFLATGLEV